MKDSLLPLRTIADVKMLCTGQPACYLERWGLVATRARDMRVRLYSLDGVLLTSKNNNLGRPFLAAW